MPKSNARRKNGKIKKRPERPDSKKIFTRLSFQDNRIAKHLNLDNMSGSALKLMIVNNFKKEVFWKEHIVHTLEIVDDLYAKLTAVKRTEKNKLKNIFEGACERISWLENFENEKELRAFLDWIVTNDLVELKDGTPLEISLQTMTENLTDFKAQALKDAISYKES